MAQKFLPFITHLVNGVQKGAVDIFVQVGSPVQAKIKGHTVNLSDDVKLTQYMVQQYIEDMYVKMAQRPKELMDHISDEEFSFVIPDVARFRASVYHQRGTLGAVIRIVAFNVPSFKDLNIPESVMELADVASGLVLVSGLTCCGKSTTQACLVDRINHSRDCHIITVEEPIEFVHRNDLSFITQREIPLDAPDMNVAVRSAMRQAPDVLVLSNLPNSDIISKAINTAESGHLVIGVIDAPKPVNAISKIVNAFPNEQHEMILNQLANCLVADISQRLIPQENGELVPEFEVLRNSYEVSDLIREGKLKDLARYTNMIGE